MPLTWMSQRDLGDRAILKPGFALNHQTGGTARDLQRERQLRVGIDRRNALTSAAPWDLRQQPTARRLGAEIDIARRRHRGQTDQSVFGIGRQSSDLMHRCEIQQRDADGDTEARRIFGACLARGARGQFEPIGLAIALRFGRDIVNFEDRFLACRLGDETYEKRCAASLRA